MVAGRRSPVAEISRTKAAYALDATGVFAGTFASARRVTRSMAPVAPRS